MEAVKSNIALYAAIKTFHSDGHDIWSTVASLALMVMPDKGTEQKIQADFSAQYQIDIPIDALRTILARLKRDGRIELVGDELVLNEEGKTARASLEKSVKDIRREYKQLSIDFQKYLKKKNVKIDGDVSKILLDFIDDNIGFASDVVTSSQYDNTAGGVPASVVAGYIVSIESQNSALFEILQSVFFGRLYMTLIKTRTEIDNDAKFTKLTIFLDTNIILDLLDLHDGERHQSATEMLAIFKEFDKGIRVAIYEETYDETINLLKSYASSGNNFTKNIGVDHPLYALKRRNIDREDLLLFIENLGDKLNSLGISIDAIENFSEEGYRQTRSDIQKVVDELDGQKSSSALSHDAKVMESIKSKRKALKVKTELLEKARVVFVTSDQNVYRYSKQYSSRSNNFPLAMRPIEIISLLWIKAIGRDGRFSGNLLRHAVMGYAKERLISDKLWESFMTRLSEARSKGEISKSDISVILAADETEKLLRSNKAGVIDEIVNQDYVDKLRDERLKMQANNSKQQERIESLEGVVQVSRSEERSANKKRISAEGQLLRVESKVHAFSHAISVIIVAIPAILLWLAVCFGLYRLLHYFDVGSIDSAISIIVLIVGMLFFLIGIPFDVPKRIQSVRELWVRRIEDGISSHITTWMTKED